MHQFGLFPFFMPNIFGNIMKFAIGECKKEVVFSAPKNRKKDPHCLLMIEDSYPLFLKFLTLSRTLLIGFNNTVRKSRVENGTFYRQPVIAARKVERRHNMGINKFGCQCECRIYASSLPSAI